MNFCANFCIFLVIKMVSFAFNLTRQFAQLLFFYERMVPEIFQHSTATLWNIFGPFT